MLASSSYDKTVKLWDTQRLAMSWPLRSILSARACGTEEQKRSVLPLVLEGETATSLPPLLRGRVYADFRDERTYFAIAFDLILSLYRLPVTDPAVADLRKSLRGRDLR
jgi:hypothetical protein